MRLQSFRHPTLIHCTCGPQTLSPRPLHREAPQTLSRLAQCKVPPVPVTVTSPAPGPLPAGTRTRAGEGTPAEVCTKHSGSGVSVIAV